MSSTNEKWVRRINALLAQAEGTDNEAEAATFMAKAQELMTKFAIEEAELAKADPTRKTRPTTVTVDFGKFGAGIKAKRILLNEIATINRCKVWMHSGRKFMSIAGFEEDVEFVQMLFGSILIQMESACVTALANDRLPGENASSFRTSFMYAYVSRVARRLKEAQAIRERHLNDATPGTAIVLRDRRTEVDQYVESKVGKLRKGAGARHRGSANGARSGDAHGRRADVSGGRGKVGQQKAIEG